MADDLAGSKRLMNFCDSSFAMGRSQMDEKTIYLKQIKVRQGENQHGRDNVILYRIVKEDNFPQFVEEGCSAEEKLLKPSKSEDKNILKAKVKILHEEGLSNRAIAKELGVAEGTVRNWLKELKEVANVLKQVRDAGITLYVITHDLELLLDCCTDIVHFEDGSIIDKFQMDEVGLEKIRNYFIKGVPTK